MLTVFFLWLLLTDCRQKNVQGKTVKIEFNQPVKVRVNGYGGNIMEPFLSRNGSILLFNNLNAAPENTNLHWATRLNDSTFEYKGEIAGVNTTDLEGVPSMDNSDNLYFVSTRNYAATLSTLYQCNLSNGIATNVQLVSGISKLQAGWVNFDVEISADGNILFFVDGFFNQGSIPASADLVIAEKKGLEFQRVANSSSIMNNINTSALEYAACISVDQLELYFTRLDLPITSNSEPEIFVSTRVKSTDPFGQPKKIEEIEGFVEAATIAPDQRTIYYHKKENNKFELYKITKK